MKISFGKSLLAVLIAAVPAVSGWSIGIDPTRCILHAARGETLKGSFTVVNDKDEEIPVIVEIAKGMDSGENKDIIKDTSWLTMPQTSFTIEPKGKQLIEFSVNVPTGTAGTFSARISFLDKSNDAYTSAVTVPVYVVVTGTEKIDWDADVLKIDRTPAGLLASLVVINKGNVHFYTSGNLMISNKKGVNCFETSIGGGRAVFPRVKTPLPFDVSKLKLEDGKYSVNIALSGYNDENRKFRYTLIKKNDAYNIRREKP